MSWLKYTLHQFVTTYLREFDRIVHDGGIMIFLILLPLAYPVVYSLIYNPEIVREVNVVIIDEDRTRLSRELVQRIDATQWVDVKGYAADMSEARKAINSREAFGILQIPEGYSKAINQGKTAEAVLYSEMSLLLRYKAMLIACTDIMTEYGSELRTMSLNNSPTAAIGSIMQSDPMPIQEVLLGNPRGGFDSYIMPGVLILILHQCIILSVGMSGGAENERKRLMPHCRAIAIPNRPRILVGMAAQSMVYITLLIIPIIFLLHYMPLIFKFPMIGNTLDIFVFIIPMVFAAIALGFILQAFVKEREAVFLLWVVTSILFLFLSGLTWPRPAMSPLWHFVSNLCPGTWGIEGFVKINANGSTLSQVSEAYCALWLQAVAYGIIAYCVQRRVVKPVFNAAGQTK